MSLQRAKKIVSKATWDLTATLTPSRTPRIETLYSAPARSGSIWSEFVRRVTEPAYIEPEFGYIITSAGRLVMEPLATTEKFGSHPWHYGVPVRSRCLQAMRSGAVEIQRFSTVINLRFLWEWNYFHFYEDVLGKLALLDKVGVDPEIPIVLGQYAGELSFAKEILQKGRFRDRNWIIPQKNTYVFAENTIYASALRTDLRAKYDYLLAQMEAPGPFPTADRRVFLTRKGGRGRQILNADAVESLLEKNGFSVVDTGNMAIEQQMDLFARTRFLIGLHGAGMANLIYRRDCPMDILELHGDGFYNHDFRDRAHAYGHDWDHLAGVCAPGDPHHADFHMPLDQLEAKMAQMLAKEDIAVRL